MFENNREIIILFCETLLVAAAGFIIFLILGRVFTSIKGPVALIITLAVVYVLYHGIKFFLLKGIN